MFSVSNAMPDAYAKISGYKDYPDIDGMVYFYGVHGGTIVATDIKNLPKPNQFHGFHIHGGNTCANPGSHYTKDAMQHPDHTGDMPPLLANDGAAYMMFYTNRFFPEDVVGKTVIDRIAAFYKDVGEQLPQFAVILRDQDLQHRFNLLGNILSFCILSHIAPLFHREVWTQQFIYPLRCYPLFFKSPSTGLQQLLILG